MSVLLPPRIGPRALPGGHLRGAGGRRGRKGQLRVSRTHSLANTKKRGLAPNSVMPMVGLMKIEIEPEIVLAGIKYLKSRQDKESDRLEHALSVLAPILAQFAQRGRPFHDEDPRDQAH